MNDDKLKNISELEEWRVRRKEYEEEVERYVEEHGFQVPCASIRACVDKRLYSSISMNLLEPEHQTGENEPPNTKMVDAFIMRTFPYDKAKSKGKAAAKIESLRFEKGEKGSTYLDRLLAFLARFREARKRIPAAVKSFPKAHGSAAQGGASACLLYTSPSPRD